MTDIVKLLKKKIDDIHHLTYNFVKWVVIASVTGAAGGVVGSFFVMAVAFSNDVFAQYSRLIFLLPLGGLAIAALYQLADFDEIKGCNRVIERVRAEEQLPLVVAPLIFVSTFITQILGGSAGREGAAIQIGGAIGTKVGHIFKLNEKDMPLIVLSGVSGVFSALFGTPLAAAFFALEVVSVGIIYYSGLIPCISSSLVAYGISRLFGLPGEQWSFVHIPGIEITVILKVVLLGVCCAAVSVLFVLSIDYTRKLFCKLFSNTYIRIASGGGIIIVLSLIFSSGTYNGTGMGIIENALEGQAQPWDFIIKIVFTAVTLGAGFKGGEIIPTFFIGATMGCVAAGLIGLDPGFGAAVGIAATFCGAVNCPVASVILGAELFGGSGLLYFTVACAVSYLLSGYYSLYGSQKIIYSKTRAEYINMKAK